MKLADLRVCLGAKYPILIDVCASYGPVASVKCRTERVSN